MATGLLNGVLGRVSSVRMPRSSRSPSAIVPAAGVPARAGVAGRDGAGVAGREGVGAAGRAGVAATGAGAGFTTGGWTTATCGALARAGVGGVTGDALAGCAMPG